MLNLIVFTSAIFAFCESAAIIDKVNKKCERTDNACQQNLYRSILQEVSDNGLPDLDIPRTDPMVIKNMEIVALGLVKMTLIDGAAKGLKGCSSTSYKNDIENQRNTIEFVCDLFTVEGDYKIESTPTLLALAGGINVHGDGKGSIAIEKLKLNLDFAYEIKKLDDGEPHFQILPDESEYSFEILGKATIAADNLFIGKQDISTVAVNIFNENWEFITKTLGKSILDKAMEVFFLNVQKFFDKVPAKDLTNDDLSSYVSS